MLNQRISNVHTCNQLCIYMYLALNKVKYFSYQLQLCRPSGGLTVTEMSLFTFRPLPHSV